MSFCRYLMGCGVDRDVPCIRYRVMRETWHASAAAFAAKYCAACHSGDEAEAGYRVDQLSGELHQRPMFQGWARLYDKVAKHEMPPPNEPQPSQAERDAVMRVLYDPLVVADLAKQQRRGRHRAAASQSRRV